MFFLHKWSHILSSRSGSAEKCEQLKLDNLPKVDAGFGHSIHHHVYLQNPNTKVM